MTLQEIAQNPKTHKGVTDIVAIAEASSIGITERTLTVDDY
jgi:hypothetical protein